MAAPPAHPLVARVNSLLSRASFPRAVASPAELSAAASPLLVACFEAVFGAALADVRRRPGGARGAGGGGGSAAADHAFNAQRAIDALAALLPPRVAIPPAVTGAAVAGGDLAALAFLVSVLDDAARALAAAGVAPGAAAAAAAAAAAEGGAARPDASAALAALGEAAATAAAAAADEARAAAPAPAPASGDEAAAVSWLSHAAVGAPGAPDVWSGVTPTKVREAAAVKAALVGGTGARGASARAPAAAGAAPPPPPSARSLSATAAAELAAKRAGAGGEGLLTEAMKADDERRREESAKLAARRAAGIMARMAHGAAEELAHISAMTRDAVRARDAALRVSEAKMLAAATARAKAAKHERKVLTMRTKLIVENLSRATLSMRIARSSRQAAAASTLLKALAGQARLGAADRLRAAATEREAVLVDASARVAWLNHTSRMLSDVMLEETARQVAQRQAATRSQKEALDRAVREMRLDEAALLRRMQAEQAHAEEAFLATHVEPMDVRAASDGPRVAAAVIADATDTDNDAARVDTLRRAHRVLADGAGRVAGSRAAAAATIKAIAGDVGADFADADALAAQGARLQAEGK